MVERVTEAWECFQDPAYFGLWAVRQSKSFEKTLHLVNADEANWLVDHLNTLAAAPPAKDEGWRPIGDADRSKAYLVCGPRVPQNTVAVWGKASHVSFWGWVNYWTSDPEDTDILPVTMFHELPAPPASEGA